MNIAPNADVRLAGRGALAGSALFVALIVVFSALGAGQPSPRILLMIHAFASPWVPAWVLFIPFMLVPVWLGLVGRFLLQQAQFVRTSTAV